MNSTDRKNTQLILKEIKHIWNNTQSCMRPWGIWICNYKSIKYSSCQYKFNSDFNRVWFLDRGQIISKTQSEYIRFYFSQIIQPWCSLSIPPSNPIFSHKEIKIGIVNFANIYNSSEYFWSGSLEDF